MFFSLEKKEMEKKSKRKAAAAKDKAMAKGNEGDEGESANRGIKRETLILAAAASSLTK